MTAYLSSYFKTKKALKDMKNQYVGYVISPSPFEFKTLDTYKGAIVGPSESERKWYATIEVVDGVLIKVS